MKVVSFQNERLPQCPGTMHAKRPKPRALVVEKGKILKASGEKKQVTERSRHQNDIKLISS